MTTPLNHERSQSPSGAHRHDHDVVVELKQRFGDAVTIQATIDELPTVWVDRARLIEVLMHLRTLPKPFVMLYDLSAVDERLRQNRKNLPDADFTEIGRASCRERV